MDEDVLGLLTEFDLKRQGTASALEALTLISGSDGRLRWALNRYGEKDMRFLRTRILRPSVGLFVRRQQEITLIKERLTVLDRALSRVAVIYGAAGIGKQLTWPIK